jgi:hypothetical protein
MYETIIESYLAFGYLVGGRVASMLECGGGALAGV